MQMGEKHVASPDTIRLIEDNYIECWSNFVRLGFEPGCQLHMFALS